MPQPLMPKATAVWLVDNTTLTFDQIAEFTGLHPLEVSGIADGEVAIGIKGFDPIANNQLSRAEIERCEKDGARRLNLLKRVSAPEPKKKAPRYTPLSKRQDRPAAIAWLVRNHPELADAQISKLLGTTKQTIQAIRDKTHWNSTNIQPVDPVALGLCRQVDLDAAVRIAAEKRAKEGGPAPVAPVGPGLMSTDESLGAEAAGAGLKGGFDGIERFGLDDAGPTPDEEPKPDAGLAAETLFGGALADAPEPEEDETSAVDADALFNIPEGAASEADEEDAAKG